MPKLLYQGHGSYRITADNGFVYDVVENPKYDFSPHVLVRRPDGKVRMTFNKFRNQVPFPRSKRYIY